MSCVTYHNPLNLKQCSNKVFKLPGQPAIQTDLPFPDIPVGEEKHIDTSLSCQFHALCSE